MIKKLILIFILPCIFFAGCETDRNPIEFMEDDTTSHNFVWTADTLHAEEALQIFLYDIWGTDEDNVWAVGHSDDSDYQIWHWDGDKWSNINPGIRGTRPSYFEIFGFSQNDFWVVGLGITGDSSGGYILHYDGNWNRVDNGDLPTVSSVWGTSSSNIYFGCHFGVIVKYNGTEFIQYKTENDVHFRCIWGFNDSTIYALANKVVDLGNNHYNSIGVFYKYFDNNFVLIDSADHYDKGFGMDLWGYDENNFYSASNGVYKYINNQWVNEFYSSTIYGVFGSSPNNVYAGGFQNSFYHFNGDNWKKIESIPSSLNNWAIWCKDDYVFVVQDFGYYRRIVKGKMTQ